MDEDSKFAGHEGDGSDNKTYAEKLRLLDENLKKISGKSGNDERLVNLQNENQRLASAIKDYKDELRHLKNVVNDAEESKLTVTNENNLLQQALIDLKQANNEERKKLKEQQERYTDEARKELDSKVTAYVTNAATKLEAKEKSLSWWSVGWGISGAFCLLAGIISLVWYTEDITTIVSSTAELTWPPLIYIAFRGIIITSLLLALSRYSFVFSKRFSDGAKEHEYRVNAINFGRLYLEAKGADAEWDVMKDAFQNWGVSSERVQSESFSEKANQQEEKSTAS